MPCRNITSGDVITVETGYKYTYVHDAYYIEPDFNYCAIRKTVHVRSKEGYEYNSPPILFIQFPCSTCPYNVPPGS